MVPSKAWNVMILRMEKRSLWKMAYAVAVLAIAGYGIAEYRGYDGGAGSKQQQIQALTSDNARLRAEIEKQQERVEKLTNDPATQELEIRKRLKLVKPNEKWYVLQDGPSEAQPAKH